MPRHTVHCARGAPVAYTSWMMSSSFSPWMYLSYLQKFREGVLEAQSMNRPKVVHKDHAAAGCPAAKRCSQAWRGMPTAFPWQEAILQSCSHPALAPHAVAVAVPHHHGNSSPFTRQLHTMQSLPPDPW